MSRFIIFSVTLFLVIFVTGSAAFIYSKRQIIRENKGNELSKELQSERIRLEASVGNEIAIALKMASSPLVQRYFAAPYLGLERIAFEELRSYQSSFASGTVFWINDIDKKFFYNDVPPYILDMEKPENYWYKMTLYETKIYNFNINYNPDLGVINLWINAPVFDADRRPLGIVGTGIDVSTYINMINKHRSDRAEIYFFNAAGEITGARDATLVAEKKNIEERLGLSVIAAAQNLDSGDTRTLDTSLGRIALGSVPLLGWYSVAVMPDSLADYNTPLTVLFLVILLVMVVVFVIFNVFIAGLLRPLRITMKEAEAANLAKSAFLSAMSHEMRTPMNAIIGMTLVGRNAADVERKNYALEKIEGASTHLLGIINNVLDMSKIEAGKLELSTAEFNFEKMLQKVVAVINFRLEEKRQRFSLKLAPDVPRFVVGDELHLAQVFMNLLANAVKFTPEQGEINTDISLASERDGVCELRVEVADSGIGISPEQQKKLFQVFEQADSGISRIYGGTGLGLAISKRIVELMGGNIRVESELGQGARFIFTVLVERGEQSAHSALGENSGLAASPDTQEETRFDGKRLLLAEDVDINREVLISLLDGTGLAIDCAGNGKEAFDMVAASPDKYDLVVMDLQMPIMDGLEATRRIRALPSLTRRLPIVAMTANVFKSDIDECLAAGMDDHVGKPLDIAEVNGKLRKYL